MSSTFESFIQTYIFKKQYKCSQLILAFLKKKYAKQIF